MRGLEQIALPPRGPQLVPQVVVRELRRDAAAGGAREQADPVARLRQAAERANFGAYRMRSLLEEMVLSELFLSK